MMIMNNYILDDLEHYIKDHLLYKSGNKVVDDFIRNAPIDNMMEFVPYDQFKDTEFIVEGKFGKIYKSTWIDGNIQSWNEKEMNLKRSGLRKVVLKKLNNSENITSKKLNEVIINLIIIYFNIIKNKVNVLIYSFKKFSLNFSFVITSKLIINFLAHIQINVMELLKILLQKIL